MSVYCYATLYGDIECNNYVGVNIFIKIISDTRKFNLVFCALIFNFLCIMEKAVGKVLLEKQERLVMCKAEQ